MRRSATAKAGRLWLLETLGGEETLLHVADGTGTPPAASTFVTLVVGGDLADADGLFGKRFDASPGSTYLVRPDQHLAARWRRADAALIAPGLGRACAAIETR